MTSEVTIENGSPIGCRKWDALTALEAAQCSAALQVKQLQVQQRLRCRTRAQSGQLCKSMKEQARSLAGEMCKMQDITSW